MRFMALAALAMLAAGNARAGEYFEKDGVAIGGYDPVAYFTQHNAVPGNPAITAQYHGSTFRFANTEDRDLFTQAPEKYAPQYNGFCTFAVAENAKAPSNPAAFRIVDGKLYLQYSAAVTKQFDAAPHKYLSEAEHNWPEVKNKKLEQ